MIERYCIDLKLIKTTFVRISKNGFVIVIANSPYGILNDLVMGYLPSEICGDFRILAKDVFLQSDAVGTDELQVSLAETKSIIQVNPKTRRTALNYLESGGAIGVFPGGTVFMAITPFDNPMDPSWGSFTAKMVAKSNAAVVLIFFYEHTTIILTCQSHPRNAAHGLGDQRVWSVWILLWGYQFERRLVVKTYIPI